MLRLGLALDELRPHDVAHTIRHEDSRSHSALLRRACDVAHADDDGLADNGAECADDGVSCYGRRSVVRPLALPDHGAAGNDGEAVDDEKDEADVGDFAGEVAAEKDCDEAECSQRELPENRFEG